MGTLNSALKPTDRVASIVERLGAAHRILKISAATLSSDSVIDPWLGLVPLDLERYGGKNDRRKYRAEYRAA